MKTWQQWKKSLFDKKLQVWQMVTSVTINKKCDKRWPFCKVWPTWHVWWKNLSLAKIGSEKLSSKIRDWIRFVMLSKAYQKSSDLKFKFYSDLFYSEILRTLPWSLVFDTPIFQILAPCLNFEGAKNIYVLSPYLGLWRTLEVPDWVWHLDLDMDRVTGLWYINDWNFGSLT